MTGTLLLLDSASLYYRSYYALPESMTAPDGRPNNAIRGFLQTITRLARLHAPTELGCCWDDDWRPEWRVALLPSYKTHRLAVGDVEGELVPDTLSPQVDAIAAIVDALGLARPGATGHEADDCIGTLVQQSALGVVVVSGDRDLVQLVDTDVRVHLAVNGGMEKWPMLDPAMVRERFGVTPQQYVDLAVLRGDPSDGIPGVPGIGEKTAIRLLGAVGSLTALYDAIDQGISVEGMTPRLQSILVEHRALVQAMRDVATIRRDAPWQGSLQIPIVAQDPVELSALSSQWGVTRWVDELHGALALDR